MHKDWILTRLNNTCCEHVTFSHLRKTKDLEILPPGYASLLYAQAPAENPVQKCQREAIFVVKRTAHPQAQLDKMPCTKSGTLGATAAVL
jgi:hypothetical protein